MGRGRSWIARPARDIVLASLIVVVLQPLSASPATAATRPTGPLSLATGSYLGAFENHDRNDSGPGSQAEVLALESATGRSIDIDNRFYQYNEQIPTALERWDVDNGRIPLVTWGAGADTIQLANGSQDTWLRAQARRMRDFGDPIFLRYYHEPDARSNNIIHSSAQFVAAWRHVYDIFQQEGATNVIWVWCPTAWTFVSQPNQAISLYPGAAYVDWVAADGYNWYPGRPNSQWRTFTQVFGDFYDWAITTGKPIMYAEIGVQEDPAQPGRKAAYLANAHQVLTTTMDQVQAALYFDTTMQKEGNTFVWNLRSSTAAFNAWRDLALDPYFNPGSSSPAIFTESFPNLAAWSPVTRVTLNTAAGGAAPPSAHAQVTNQNAFARRSLGGGFSNVCLSSAVRLNSIGSGANVQLLKLRAGSTNVARLVVTPGRVLRLRNDVTAAFLSGGPTLPTGWHTLELCATVGAGTGSLRVSLDGIIVTKVAGQNLGTASLTGVQIGDDTAKTFNADWDDVIARP